MSLEMSQHRELTTGARGSDAMSCCDSAGRTPPIPLTGRSAKCGIRRVVPADHEAPGQHMQRRLQESQDVATRNRREEIGLANQVTSTAEHGHGARSRERHTDVGLKPFETRPHHVSGARRVAAPVPRTGEQAHGLPNNSVPSTRSKWREEKLCGRSTSDHTNRVWRPAKLGGDSK